MFNRILVPEVGGRGADMASAVARRLAELWSLEIRSPASTVEAIVTDIESEPGALLIMSSHARSRAGAVLSDLADKVTHRVAGPMLLVGPRADLSSDWPSGPILICSDGTDFSEAIVRPAALWAKALGVEPRLLTATEQAPILACADPAQSGSPNALAGIVESVVGREVNYDLLHGTDPAAVIADHAHWHHASMIALATHGRTGFARLTKGSVTMRVLSGATCPILIQGPVADTDGG